MFAASIMPLQPEFVEVVVVPEPEVRPLLTPAPRVEEYLEGRRFP